MIKVLFAALLIAGTAGAYQASVGGFGLAGGLDEPISIRDGSKPRARGHFIFLPYFRNSGRRHHGGGFRHGK